jgi:hypothetical protein
MESINDNKFNVIYIDKISKLFDEKLERQLNKLDNYKYIDNMIQRYLEIINKMQERVDTLFELVIKLCKDNNVPMDDMLDEALINN